jgi:hypothetical protein
MSLPTPEITLPALTTATVDKQPERSVYPPDGPDRAVLAAPRMAATALSRPRGALRAQPLCSGLTRPPAARVCATRAPEWAEVAPAPPERSRRRCGGNTVRPPAVHTAPSGKSARHPDRLSWEFPPPSNCPLGQPSDSGADDRQCGVAELPRRPSKNVPRLLLQDSHLARLAAAARQPRWRSGS